jgi:UDP-glucose 4-epimerase
MSKSKTVLVTGVAGYWGAQLADRLVTETDYHVIGLDASRPEQGVQGLDYLPIDVRNPALVDLLRTESVDAVCHLAFTEALQPNEAAFDLNVMGTTKLLGACAEAGVSKVLLKSSTAVYGARPSNPAFLTENHPLRGSKRVGTVRDLVQIEAFCNGFSRERPEMALTVLRFASIIGPTADTPVIRYLKDRWAPSLAGFDPLMQFIHEDDVVEALVHAMVSDVPGAFNVAAEDVLPLNKVRGLTGKPRRAVLHPFAYWRQGLPGRRSLGLARHLPLDPDYLRYPWIADLTKMRDELGFTPRYLAEDALLEFAEQRRLGQYLPKSTVLAQSEERLRAIISHRERGREWRGPVEDLAQPGGETSQQEDLVQDPDHEGEGTVPDDGTRSEAGAESEGVDETAGAMSEGLVENLAQQEGELAPPEAGNGVEQGGEDE